VNGSATTQTESAGGDQILDRDTAPAEVPSVEVAATSPAESEVARLKVITAQLAEDVRPLVDRLTAVPERARPLVERARPWADVFLPLVDEMRPLMDDLRPVAHDLRALSGELVSRAGGVAALVARIDLRPVRSVGQIAGAGAQRLASMRPTPRVIAPSLSIPLAIRAPRVTPPVVRLPSLSIGAGLRSSARRLRPGRWAFRTVAVTFVVLVAGTPSLQDAMVEEINWTRSVVQTMELPTVQMPTVELPTLELPTLEIPRIEIPNIQLPTIQMPTQESAAPAKLAPAQFELPPLDAYHATFETQATYPTVQPNATVEWVIALRNTGSVGWYRGVDGAQASLALTDGTVAAVQTTAYVAPGQVGWFIARFRAPAGPGTHAVALFPRIDGRGELPDLGIFTLVTVR
jgi:hypothetical protein